MQELFKIALLAVKISIMVQLFAIGLGATWTDATYLFRQPKLLLNSVLARNVAVPLVAIALIRAFSLTGPIAIAMGVLSITPVPPLVPKAQLKAGARAEYVLGLLTSQAVLAIVLVPLTIQFMDWALGSDAQFSARQVASLILQSILIPLGVGMLAARLMPALQRFAQYLVMAGTVLLVAGVLPLLVVAWKAYGALAGNGTMLAVAIFVIACTAVGHLLGGPEPGNRTALALATSGRHPALALAIVKSNFPEQSAMVAGAVVIYLIIRMILTVPYLRKRRQAHA
jgi:bile acid:Na+ symporter, BASS family